jgi:hypothetical protein
MDAEYHSFIFETGESRDMQRQDTDRHATAVILARALARRLSSVMPPGISVTSRGGDVVVSDGRDSDGTGLVPLVDQPGDLEENITIAASAILNTVQDLVTLSLGRGWPASREAEPDTFESAAKLPLPSVEVKDRSLRLWYGEPDRPALELEPIDLADLL